MSRAGKYAPDRAEQAMHSGLLVSWDIQEQSLLGKGTLLPEGPRPFPPTRWLFCPPGLISPTHRGSVN